MLVIRDIYVNLPHSDPRARLMSGTKADVRSVLVQTLTIVSDSGQFSSQHFASDLRTVEVYTVIICMLKLCLVLTRYQVIHKSIDLGEYNTRRGKVQRGHSHRGGQKGLRLC